MQNALQKSSAVFCEAEQALRGWGVKYEWRPDGTLFVPKDIDIVGRGLSHLPDLSDVVVGGDFCCYDNRLTSLKGAPRAVGGNFECDGNQLETLAGAPGNVGGGFSCACNLLISLGGAPISVGGDFECGNNRLRSLSGAPLHVNGGFYCDGNALSSLEHAPQNFALLSCDFGYFENWGNVPEELRISPEERETVLQHALSVSKPIRFKRRS